MESARMGQDQRTLREAALRALDTQLARQPDAIDLRFERACVLGELGRLEEARDAYLDLLTRDSAHAGALNNLGALLYATGYRRASRTAYTQAVGTHPDDPIGHVNLANALRDAGELAEARTHYETALRLAPEHAHAHQGIAILLDEEGDAHGAERHRRLGFRGRSVTTLPYYGHGTGVRLLLIVSAVGGNVPIERLLDRWTFATTVIVAEFHDESMPLPAHNLVVNGIGEADLCASALGVATKIIAKTTAPVINAPTSVLATGRVANAARLAGIDDVVTPTTIVLPRERLAAADAATAIGAYGVTFPLLLRAPGFHTGRHFVQVAAPEQLVPALKTLPGPSVLVIQYLDARRADGTVRKYRTMFIGGEIYPLHLAIARDWKVHYFSADMADHAEHRTEEARFLADMAGAIGSRGAMALRRVRDALGLDYAGVDFALDPEGKILLFEANATMVVNPPAPDGQWDYRREAVARIHDAVRKMLMERAAIT